MELTSLPKVAASQVAHSNTESKFIFFDTENNNQLSTKDSEGNIQVVSATASQYSARWAVSASASHKTDNPLTIGTEYTIASIGDPSDDFTNVGAASNNVGVVFTASGTTAAVWTQPPATPSPSTLDYNILNTITPTTQINTIGTAVLSYDGTDAQIVITGAFADPSKVSVNVPVYTIVDDDTMTIPCTSGTTTQVQISVYP